MWRNIPQPPPLTKTTGWVNKYTTKWPRRVSPVIGWQMVPNARWESTRSSDIHDEWTSVMCCKGAIMDVCGSKGAIMEVPPSRHFDTVLPWQLHSPRSALFMNSINACPSYNFHHLESIVKFFHFNLAVCLCVCVCVCECVFLCQSVSVCVCFFACLSVWLTGCVSQSVVSLKSVNYVSYPWVWLIGRVSVYVSLCLSLCVWLWMSVCVTLCLWLSVCVCVCMWFVYLCLTLLVGCLCIRWKRKVCLFIVLFV